MDYRFLGKTGLKVSRLALGTMSFGAEADEAEAGRMFARCRDAGINLFDTADVYAKGRSEEILGRLIQGSRDELVIATKAYFPTSRDPNARGSSRYHLVRAVEASLRRLGTDRIDLFFLHRMDDHTALEETLRAVELLVSQGKVTYPAVSNFAAWQTARALGIAERFGWAPIVAMQPMYNLLKRQAEVEIFELARAEQLGVFPYSPLAGGLLTGKYGGALEADSGRIAANPMYRTRYGDPKNFEIAASFSALARELGHHPATLAVAWVASNPAVTAPILGARGVAQLEPSLAAGELTLSEEIRGRVSALSPEPPPATDRNEERSGELRRALTRQPPGAAVRLRHAMAKIVVLLMGGSEAKPDEIAALAAAGHEVKVVEPRYPECKRELEGERAALVIIDGSRSPSHGRAVASWLASLSRYRTVPFLFLDVPDKDMARVTKELPRAQFATWASVVGASERLIAAR